MSDDEGRTNPIRSGFREGLEVSKIGGRRDAFLRAIVFAFALVVAWWVPAIWYWKVVTFIAIMFIAGIVISAIRKRD
jgi:hypothetical protein